MWKSGTDHVIEELFFLVEAEEEIIQVEAHLCNLIREETENTWCLLQL